MTSHLSARSPDWLTHALAALRDSGYAIVEDVVAPALLSSTREAMYRVQRDIAGEIGAERLARAGENGVLRLMLRHDPLFFTYLEIPEVLELIDRTVSETAILHLQNGFILPPARLDEDTARVFQYSFHRDFPRYLEGYRASVNVFFAVDAFSAENGGTVVVPGTHQRADAPDASYMNAHAVAIECPPGSMLVFDSTLWHASGINRSGADRLAINHQFTRSFIKQQIDYVRALGDATVLAQKPRTQQLLGWYTRLPTSLDEYYRSPEERLYRSGQG
jgi:ectoine hydroxylase-related dioxygenase (phytanoyl-CoA dioxygenase family)